MFGKIGKKNEQNYCGVNTNHSDYIINETESE